MTKTQIRIEQIKKKVDLLTYNSINPLLNRKDAKIPSSLNEA